MTTSTHCLEHPLERFPADEFEGLMAAPATWYRGMPVLSGLAQYTVAIRSPHDPTPMTRSQRQASGVDADSWRSNMKGDVRSWAASLLWLWRREGRSLTFNAAITLLTRGKYTADVALGRTPEDALWLLVRRGWLLWANLADGAVWFALVPPSWAPEMRASPASSK